MAYLCPVDGEPLKDSPDAPAGMDDDGRLYPVTMGCLTCGGLFGRRAETREIVSVYPAGDDFYA